MKAQIRLLLTVQLSVMIGYLIVIFIADRQGLVSAATGCLASLLPSLYFSFRMLRCSNVDDAAQWLSHAYRSDIGKWVLAGVIFALAFSSGYQWDPIILFIGYLLVQMSAMFLPIMFKGN
jgi:F0F1-type ATP synthase assembly protein I